MGDTPRTAPLRPLLGEGSGDERYGSVGISSRSESTDPRFSRGAGRGRAIRHLEQQEAIRIAGEDPLGIDRPARVSSRERDTTDRVPPQEDDPLALPQAGSLGELLAQEQPDEPRYRGTPAEERPDTRNLYRRRGEERIRALTDLFGQDALVLGHLLFRVPPLAIRIKKGNITYRWKPLRTRESIAVKSGSGECSIEIDLVFVGLNQIQSSLSELIALWDKVPFCFIENTHIRKMMTPDSPDESMAVCLETLVLDAVSGQPNTVYATLLMKWFNYKPYSQNFWFRRTWDAAEITGTNPSRTSSTTPLDVSEETAQEGSVETPEEDREGTTILTDLSSMQDPNILDVLGRNLPPEVGLTESEQRDNPGDPSIKSTYPVVYPFNSEPFLARVRQGSFVPRRINSWTDGLQMSWNSFIRLQVPNNWAYNTEGSNSVALSSVTTRDRSDERVPPAVTGERDIILFIGDSLMVGFTNQASNPATYQGNWGTPTFYDWTGNTRFRVTPGFTYKAMFRVGAGTGTLRNWWNAKKDDASLKAEGNPNPCSRVAGVLIASGINDGSTGPTMSALRTIMTEASGFGAIPMLCSLPPVCDSDSNSKLSQLRTPAWWGDSDYETFERAVPDYHRAMTQLVGSIENAILIDTHEILVEDQFRGNRAAPLATTYQAPAPSPYASTHYNIHWNTSGYNAAGDYVRGSMPWNSLRGIEAPADTGMWHATVCHVEDGDTVWVWGNSPETGEPTVRNIRMKFIDTPETYHDFRVAAYNAGGASPMPEGQDSYRPAAAKYGEIARAALAGRLSEGTAVEIDIKGTGAYGRYLGVIHQGDRNLNLWMVQQGHAWAMASSDRGEQEESDQYTRAQEIAQGQGDTSARGIWAAREQTLIGLPAGFDEAVAENLRRLMDPGSYRAVYAAATDGGHDGVPSACLQAPWEQAETGGGADVDEDH